MSLLDARDLAFGYPAHGVGSVSEFRLDANEVVCVLGPNGSGKTTLFKTLLGVLPPLAGEVRVSGDLVSTWSRRRFARVVGYVPQAHGAVFPYSVIDVVLMGRTAHLGMFGQPSKHDAGVGRECLDTLGIGGLATRIYTELSGGERQLVLIARALAQEPRLLIMDEPAASLDFGNQIRVLEHIGHLRARGLAVLMSTHQPDHARRVATRVMLLKDGHVLADAEPSTLLTSEQLGTLYGIAPGRIGTGWNSPG